MLARSKLTPVCTYVILNCFESAFWPWSSAHKALAEPNKKTRGQIGETSVRVRDTMLSMNAGVYSGLAKIELSGNNASE